MYPGTEPVTVSTVATVTATATSQPLQLQGAVVQGNGMCCCCIGALGVQVTCCPTQVSCVAVNECCTYVAGCCLFHAALRFAT